ncbi:MAG: hypothetical protein AB1847_02900 [bacterium]
MNAEKRTCQRFFILALFILISGLLAIQSSTAAAANWQPLPPYNTLWPLWSPPLSPVNALTGLPTPIVNQISRSTVLPVQPGLTWDPRKTYPWLLYNTPLGLCYYDPYYGINSWPPSSLLDPLTGLPAPIDLVTLKIAYTALAPTSSSWLAANVPVANVYFFNTYPPAAVASTPPLSSLLTPAILLGW